MSVPLSPNDPAYWMLEKGRNDPTWRSEPNLEIYRESCYICVDPEFSLMGLPLCKPCVECGGHLPADDEVCENGHNNNPYGE